MQCFVVCDRSDTVVGQLLQGLLSDVLQQGKQQLVMDTDTARTSPTLILDVVHYTVHHGCCDEYVPGGIGVDDVKKAVTQDAPHILALAHSMMERSLIVFSWTLRVFSTPHTTPCLGRAPCFDACRWLIY